MSNRARALVLGATLAAMTLAGMTTVAQAQANDQPTSTQDARRPATEAQVGESWRHRQVDRQASAGEAGDQGKAAEPSQAPSAQYPRRYLRPEPPVAYGPPLDRDEPLFPAPVQAAPAEDRGGGLAVVVTVAVVALLLALGAAATWRVRHRRPQPESTA